MSNVRLDFSGMQPFESAVISGLVAGVDAAAQLVAGEMKRGFSRTARYQSSAPGSPPGVQTGRLRNSVAVKSSGVLRRQVGTNVPYGRIHEFGGTITAKNGSLLVPIGPKGRQALRDSGGNVRSLNLFIIKRKGRPPILAQGFSRLKGPGKGSVTPLFVLLKSVTLPPRPWVMPAFARSKPRLAKTFETYARRRIAERLGVRK